MTCRFFPVETGVKGKPFPLPMEGDISRLTITTPESGRFVIGIYI